MARGRRGCPLSVTKKHPLPVPVMPVSPESFSPKTEPIVSGTSEAVNHPLAAIYAESGTVPQVQIQSSYAQLVYPNKGTKLSFVPPQLINGIKCNHLEKSEVESEAIYWQNAVLCTVLGVNPPFEVMKGFLQWIWASYDIDKILYVRKGRRMDSFHRPANRGYLFPSPLDSATSSWHKILGHGKFKQYWEPLGYPHKNWPVYKGQTHAMIRTAPGWDAHWRPVSRTHRVLQWWWRPNSPTNFLWMGPD